MPLSLDGTGSITGIGTFNFSDEIVHVGDDNTKIRFPANDTITAETSGVERFRITSAGNVGIGSEIPAGMLEVQKNGVPAIIANYNNQKHLQMGAGGSGAGFHLTTGNFFTINHQPYADRGTDNNLTERLRIDSTGRISSGKHGVGTHNDANEWFKVQSNDSAANISIVASNDTHSSLNLGDEDDFNIQKIRSDHTNNSLQFFTADAERLRIGSSGQIGLGGANYGTSGQVLTSQGSGSAVQWASPSSGLAMADQWRRTATLNTSNAENFITTDWARVSGGGFGTLGTGMSESGGIFTFPSTGIYLVTWQAYAETSTTSGVNAVNIYITTDNSSYNNRASSIFSMEYDMSGYNYGNGHCSAMIDVTSVSNVKVKFRVYSSGTVAWDISSSQNRNCATFLRLGNT